MNSSEASRTMFFTQFGLKLGKKTFAKRLGGIHFELRKLIKF